MDISHGTVKWFSEEKGYGFISPTTGARMFSCIILA
jgi:cold shock CspA family protein